MADELTRVPPQSFDAEQSVLGACLISGRAARAAHVLLTAEDFYHRPHALLFAITGALLQAGKPPDSLTVTEELRRCGKLEAVGGVAYVNVLCEAVPTAAHVEHYAKIVQEKADLRAWIGFLSQQEERCYGNRADLGSLEAEFVRFMLARRRRQYALHDLSVVAMDELDRITAGMAEATCGLGLSSVDRVTGGASRGTVGLVCGTPGSGKSVIGLMQAEHCAQTWGPTLVFSLEMPETHLARRALAGRSGMTFRELQAAGRWDPQGRFEVFTDEELDQVTEAVKTLSRFKYPLKIDTESYQLGPLVHRLHLYKAEHGIEAVVIDYGQLLEDEKGAESRTVEMMRISRTLKHVAQALNVVIFVLVQPTQEAGRRGGTRKTKNPSRITMSDILGGRQWNADAQQICLLHPDPGFSSTDTQIGVILEVAKNRNGGRGEVKLILDAPRFVFREQAARDDAPVSRDGW